jgi:Protein of unknown function (DUF3800)
MAIRRTTCPAAHLYANWPFFGKAAGSSEGATYRSPRRLCPRGVVLGACKSSHGYAQISMSRCCDTVGERWLGRRTTTRRGTCPRASRRRRSRRARRPACRSAKTCFARSTDRQEANPLEKRDMFVLYVDESGKSGLEDLAQPYYILGGLIVDDAAIQKIESDPMARIDGLVPGRSWSTTSPCSRRKCRARGFRLITCSTGSSAS